MTPLRILHFFSKSVAHTEKLFGNYEFSCYDTHDVTYNFLFAIGTYIAPWGFPQTCYTTFTIIRKFLCFLIPKTISYLIFLVLWLQAPVPLKFQNRTVLYHHSYLFLLTADFVASGPSVQCFCRAEKPNHPRSVSSLFLLPPERNVHR